MNWVSVLFVVGFIGSGWSDGNSPEPVFKWKFAEFDQAPGGLPGGYPNYKRENNIITGFAYDSFSNRMFFGIPRNAPGVPATLAVVEMDSAYPKTSPLVAPFPNYDINSLKECDFLTTNEGKKIVLNNRRSLLKRAKESVTKITSTFGISDKYKKPPRRENDEIQADDIGSDSNKCDSRKRIISIYHPVVDKCKRLWFMDTGLLEYPTGVIKVKDPQLWVLDISSKDNNYKILRRFTFNKKLIKDAGGLSSLEVDISSKDCENTFAYVTNMLDNRLVVYDYYNHDSWIFNDYSFKGDSEESNFVYEENLSTFQAGLFSITLGYRNRDGYRHAFYISGASSGQYAVNTHELQNRRQSPRLRHPDLVGYRGCNSQAKVHVFDKNIGVMFWAESQSKKVRCWNVNRPLRPENIGTVFEDDEFVFGSDIKVDRSGNLWFLSNKFPLFKSGQYDYNKENIRLYSIKAEEAILNTVCEDSKDRPKIELDEEGNVFLLGEPSFNVTEVISDQQLGGSGRFFVPL